MINIWKKSSYNYIITGGQFTGKDCRITGDKIVRQDSTLIGVEVKFKGRKLITYLKPKQIAKRETLADIMQQMLISQS